MPIVINVEDGSNVPNANAYISVAEFRTYCEDRGIELPVDNDEVAAMLIKSTDYLETFACQYLGKPTYPTQSLQWPRTGVEFHCEPFPDNAIPKTLKTAQSQLAIAVSQGIDLQPNISAADYVVEETVGPITTKYADPIAAGVAPVLTAANSALAPLFGNCGQSFGIRTRRV